MPLQFEQPEERVSLPQPLPAEQVAAPEPITQATPKQKRVQRLLRFLSPFNKVRKLAEPVLKADSAPSQSPPASLAPIQKSFSRNFAARWREKEVALAYLSKANLTDEQKKEAVSFLSKFLQTTTRKRITRLGWNLFWLEGTILGSLVLFSMDRVSGVLKSPITAIGDWWEHTWIRLIAPVMNWIDTLINTTDSLAFGMVSVALIIPFVIFLPLTLTYMAWDAFKLKRVQGDTLDTLGVLEEVSAIPVVAEYASKGSKTLRERAALALTKLYPRLTPEHLGTLSAQTVPNLCKTLSGGESNFVLATLHALELIGDVRAVPALKQLAEKQESVEVRETAQRLIYILEAREEGTVQKMSLLRASHAPKEASEHLLRPAHGKPETDVSELLRPSEGGED